MNAPDTKGDVEDRTLLGLFPRLRLIWSDGGDQGQSVGTRFDAISIDYQALLAT